MMRWSMGMSDCESRSMVDFDSGLEVDRWPDHAASEQGKCRVSKR